MQKYCSGQHLCTTGLGLAVHASDPTGIQKQLCLSVSLETVGPFER